MTTLFYDGQDLHADKQVIHDCFPSFSSDNGNKLFINQTNTIAIGVSDILPDDKHKTRLFNAAHELFNMLYLGLLQTQTKIVDLKEHLPELWDSDDLIAITHNKALIIRDGIIFPQTGYLGALGTGARSIVPCYYVVQDIVTAFRLNAELDTLSSANFVTVKAELLSPYIVG